MDKTNLESLVEEEEEGGEEEEEDNDDEDDASLNKREPNKFEGLADGIINHLAILHSCMTDLLDVKDELLRHALPPNVKVKLTLTITKTFRSISDLHLPLNELIRLVRLYSTPWEEKSTSLRKLHDDYNTKKEQLNIAVKRLQQQHHQEQQLQHERRILNWEKLFSKLTSRKAVGRRWKFLIERFKKEQEKGPDGLHQYINHMNREETEVTPAAESQDLVSDTETSTPSSDSEDLEPPLNDLESKVQRHSEVTIKLQSDPHIVIKTDPDLNTKAALPVVILRPPVKDMNVGPPDYIRYLCVHIYDINISDSIINLAYGSQKKSVSMTESGSVTEPGSRPKHHRGRRKMDQSYEEVSFLVPSVTLRPWKPQGRENPPSSLQISVQNHLNLVAMATIYMDDLGDIEVVDSVWTPVDDDLPIEFPLYSVTDQSPTHQPVHQISMKIFYRQEAYEQTRNQLTGTTDDIDYRSVCLSAMSFQEDVINEPIVDINQTSEHVLEDVIVVSSVHDIHEDIMDSDDPRQWIEDDIMKEEEKKKHYPAEEVMDHRINDMRGEDVVSRVEYEKLRDLHKQEIEALEADFNRHLQTVVNELLQNPGIQRTKTEPLQRTHTEPVRRTQVKYQVKQPMTSVWGQHLPTEFLDRLLYFSKSSQKHQQEIFEKLTKEERDNVEKRLRAKHHLACERGSEQSTADICLPALFFSAPSSRPSVYNPRASRYFHVSGSSHSRLTQPPSVMNLPPIPNKRLALLNLFELTNQKRNPPGNKESIIVPPNKEPIILLSSKEPELE